MSSLADDRAPPGSAAMPCMLSGDPTNRYHFSQLLSLSEFFSEEGFDA
jgi:hypothetical protein